MSGPGLASIAFMITLAAAAVAVVHHANVRSDKERAAESGWILDVVVAGHAAVYIWLTLATREVNVGVPHLIPFSDLGPAFQYWFTEWIPDHGLTQVPAEVAFIAVNFLLLAPSAAIAPLRWPWLATGKRVLIGAVAVAGVNEILQAILGRGRVVSFDDVLVQVLGALAVFAMTRAALNARERRLSAARKAGPGDR